ncbi:MAG: hypothetical protein ACKVQR_22995 [Aquabacterium sp.]
MWLIVAALLWLASNTAHAQILCTADFSTLGQGLQTVSVRLKPEGSFEASVNGLTTNAHGTVVDDLVRPGLNLSADPYGAEFASFNLAERSLVHLQGVLAITQGRGLIQVPFPLSSVRRMKTFDLAGKTDKFGGHVLLEALDDRGNVLGRVVRRVLVAPCSPP